jgi:hypothetical protein
MASTIELTNPVGHAEPSIRGPFARVEITHRRLWGDGSVIATRGGDGAWRDGRHRYLEARVSAGGLAFGLTFASPWRGGVQTLRTRIVSLVGDGLWSGNSVDQVAFDSDDDRTWIAGPDGDAYDTLIVTDGQG